MSDTQTRSELRTTSPSDAFQALGNDVRMSIIRTLAEANEDGAVVPTTKSFSQLHEASETDTSAQFAYHLRQLTDHYLEEEDDGYRFTYAGLKIARTIAAGTYTDSVDIAPVLLETACPFCAEPTLEAQSDDNYLSIGCSSCERRLLTLPFLPGGYQAHSPEDLLCAFDRHYRHRVGLMADGFCPECGAAVDASVKYAPEQTVQPLPDAEDAERVQCHLNCGHCGYRLRCPVTLSVLDHSAVVSFYYEHGIDIQDRPVWNVGSEWREAVLSDDPWCVCVSTQLDDELLSLFVGNDTTVADIQRQQAS